MKKYKAKTFFIVLVVFLLIGSMAACANDEPVATPEALPEDIPAADEATPAPPPEPAPAPEPAPEPGRIMPASWSGSQIFIHEPYLALDVSADWRGEVDGEAYVYYFNQDSDIPRLSLYQDTVRGIDDFDEFFDWWLPERFNNPQYNDSAEAIRQEFVEYNGIRGLEIDYIEHSDETLRIALYIFYERMYYHIRFAFEPDGDGPYKDEIAYVFNSIRKTNTELDAWPTEYLPANTPIYTDGGSIDGYAYVSEANGDVMINIQNTSVEALSVFVSQMEKLGWTIDYFDTEEGSGGGSNGSWNVHIYMEDGTTAVLGFNFYLE